MREVGRHLNVVIALIQLGNWRRCWGGCVGKRGGAGEKKNDEIHEEIRAVQKHSGIEKEIAGV